MWRRFPAYALASWLCVACSSDHDDHAQTSTLSDVLFVGGTTDEALSVMLDSAPKTVASERVSFLSPEASAVLDKDAPATIQFQGARAERPSPAPRMRVEPSRVRRALRDLQQFLSPIAVAYAHGEPLNGTAYFLVFADASGAARLRVFTDQTTYTPDNASWSHLAAGRQPIELTITSATFEENAVLADGGPFAAGELQFSVR